MIIKALFKQLIEFFYVSSLTLNINRLVSQFIIKMKKIYLIVLLFAFSMSMFAQSKLSLEKYLENNKEAYLQIQVSSEKEVKYINSIISIDLIDENHIALYVTDNNLEKFLNLNLDYEIITNPSKIFMPEMFDGSKEIYEWDTYPTYEAYISIMEQFAIDFPDICEVFSIGESVEGRELKFVKISDNVSENEAEPQFLYTGTMHGDETTGYVLLLRLIDYLTSNYGTDAEVTEMVDNIEIWINPAANPDGTYAGGNNSVWGATRSNANGVNLNRNYPDPQDGPHPDGNAWQAETLAFMDMAESNHFVMAANTHGGAEVVNYPWDTWSQLAADDDWWQFVSHEYADTAQANSPSFYMNGFNDGITNGYAWYSIDGGRQDYMNYFHFCREVTLEISDIKTIPENQLINHWNYNKRALINYMKQVMYGVHGIVTDSITEEPLEGVKVEIIGHDFDESHVFSDAVNGDYYRLLKQGVYDITFTKDGYIPKTIEDVFVNDYETTILDVQLVSASLIANFSADFTDLVLGGQAQFSEQCYGDIDSYSWSFEGGTPSASSDANPVITYNQVGSFDVSLTIFSGSDSQTITKEDFITVNEQYIIGDGEITTCSGLFTDDGGLDGNYSDDLDLTYTIYGDASNIDAILSVEFIDFNIEDHATCDYDYLKIYDGANTNAPLLGTYCGTNSPGFVEANNNDNALTFVFHSDGSVNESGWRAIINCTIIDQINELDKSAIRIYPNPATTSINIDSEELIEGITIYNVAGKLIESIQVQSSNTYQLPAYLDKGVYLMYINTKNANYIEKLIIE